MPELTWDWWWLRPWSLLDAALTQRPTWNGVRGQRRGPRVWFTIDEQAAEATRCAACRETGVARRQPLEAVAFCSPCLDRTYAPTDLDWNELGWGD